MSNQERKITRQELYEALWLTPMNKLAMEWGEQVAWLVKACEEMKVPRPGPGHWQLVARGWAMDWEPLPAATAESKVEIVLGSEAEKPKEGRQKTSAAPKPVVELITEVGEMHELVRGLYARMADAPTIEHGPVKVEEAVNFRVWVSKAQVKRAMAILNALVVEVEKRGAKFAQEATFDKHLVAKFPTGKTEFQIVEAMDYKWVPTKRERRPEGGYFQQHEWRYYPSGKLSFGIKGYWPKGVRKYWNDGKKQRVEDCLTDIIECMVRYPELEREQLEARQREIDNENAIRHERYLRRSAPERLEKMRAEMQSEIEAQGDAWRRACAMREFLTGCEVRLRTKGKELPDWGKQWLDWGKTWVDEVDPMTNGFFDELPAKFSELQELEAFVEQLRKETKSGEKTDEE
jgi:hypothetical protein